VRFLRWLLRLIDFSGNVQFVVSVVGSIGLVVTTLGALWAVATPETTAGYMFVGGLACASVLLWFPVSASLVNMGLTRVEAKRRIELFDDPKTAALKYIDSRLVEGKLIWEHLPVGDKAYAQVMHFHAERINRWSQDTDLGLVKVDSKYASYLFNLVDDRESWRRNPDSDGRYAPTPDGARLFMNEKLEKLEFVRTRIPVTATILARESLALDIESGRALAEFYSAPRSSVTLGVDELENWATGVRGTFEAAEMPAYLHRFSKETYAGLSEDADKVQYIEGRIQELEKIFAEL
jgi:hypothetical protein